MKASVIGAGSWGSAFALHLGRQNIETQLWVREQDIYDEIVRKKENRIFLPDFIFPSSVSFFHELKDAVNKTDVVFIAVPSKFCRSIYKQLAPLLSSNQILVSLTKGIEKDSLKRMSEVMEEVFLPYFYPKIAVLSGPSFSREVAERHPTAVVIAAKDFDLAKCIQHLISNEYFRAYTSNDITGVEIAGAFKNVIAIAAGISAGLQFGNNSAAALVTRGIAEIARFGVKLGSKMETFSGLAGIGDLVLTCTGKLSRNRYVGYELGKGKSLAEITSNMKMIAEGIITARSSYQLAKRENVEMPICKEVYQVLYNNKSPRTALQYLMSRKLKNEYY